MGMKERMWLWKCKLRKSTIGLTEFGGFICGRKEKIKSLTYFFGDLSFTSSIFRKLILDREVTIWWLTFYV